ncbi:MAG: DUF4446 family protein [Mycobacterium leprae]
MYSFTNLDPLVIAFFALAVSLIVLVIMLVSLARQAKLLKRYRTLLQGKTGQDLETLLLTQVGQLNALQDQAATITQDIRNMVTDARRHVQKVAVVRFNAFPDTGADLSFAIAVLNAENDGFVLSSLYGRNENRVYAKPIKNGTSTYMLSDEEKDALQKAIS